MGYRKPCANPACLRSVLETRKPRNTRGVSLYCSLRCFSAWPPRMAEIAQIVGVANQAELRVVLVAAINQWGEPIASRILDLSSDTLREWVGKLDKLEQHGTKIKRDICRAPGGQNEDRTSC